jgi:adenylate cyclase
MAMEMKKALVELRKSWELAGVSESLDVRMGVHSDMCTVGNFGSLDRLDYTVLGNGVNLASRLESLADSNEILISENTYNLINKEINCNYFDSLTVKGKAHSIKTFQVIGEHSDKKSFSKINTSKEGFRLQIDKSKIKDVDEVLQLLKDSIEELNK